MSGCWELMHWRARYHNCDYIARDSHVHVSGVAEKNKGNRQDANCPYDCFASACTTHMNPNVALPLTCCTDVSFRSHRSSNGCAAAGSKSFVYCRSPDDVVKQHLHMQEWYRKRPSSRYGCANASITDIRLSYEKENGQCIKIKCHWV